MITEAMITKEMLIWARKRRSDSLDDASKILNIDKAKLNAWEKGESRPSFHQAQVLAKRLNIPFGYLYLSKPPDESLPLPDLRVKSGVSSKKPSPDFLEVLYDAMRKQEWYRDYLNSEEADPVPFVNRYSMSSPIERVTEDIRQTISLDDNFRQKTRGKEEYYTELVKRIESSGVLVMRSSIVGNNTRRSLDPNEFQGFSMTDAFAPLIFVNQSDFLSAQIFTLIHELAHIWLGISGVSVQDYLDMPIMQDELSQQRANDIAAETLVPSKDFIARWQIYNNIDQGLIDLQRHYRVSIFVVLRRAYSLGMISFDIYRSKYNELRLGIPGKKKGGGGGGYQALFSRNSTILTTTILNSVSEGRTLPTQASRLLNVHPITIYNMQFYLASRGRTHA